MPNSGHCINWPQNVTKLAKYLQRYAKNVAVIIVKVKLHALFTANTENGDLACETRQQNVISNPHIVHWFFTERLESFVKHWLFDTLGAKWHWF